MRLVRGFVIFAVGALLAVPFAVLMLLVFPRQTAGSEAADLQQVVALLFGGPLCLAIGVLLSKGLFDAIWKTGLDRD